MVAGCGFHLRLHQAQLRTQYPVIILPSSGSLTLHQALLRALDASAVRVLDKPSPKIDYPQLVVAAQTLTVQPLVYGPDSELRRERLKLNVTFNFGTSKGPITSFELSTERDRQLNSNQHLGDNAEKVLIEQEMQADIIGQCLRFIANHHAAHLPR